MLLTQVCCTGKFFFFLNAIFYVYHQCMHLFLVNNSNAFVERVRLYLDEIVLINDIWLSTWMKDLKVGEIVSENIWVWCFMFIYIYNCILNCRGVVCALPSSKTPLMGHGNCVYCDQWRRWCYITTSTSRYATLLKNIPW